jgi:hypothetical protein
MSISHGGQVFDIFLANLTQLQISAQAEFELMAKMLEKKDESENRPLKEELIQSRQIPKMDRNVADFEIQAGTGYNLQETPGGNSGGTQNPVQSYPQGGWLSLRLRDTDGSKCELFARLLFRKPDSICRPHRAAAIVVPPFFGINHRVARAGSGHDREAEQGECDPIPAEGDWNRKAVLASETTASALNDLENFLEEEDFLPTSKPFQSDTSELRRAVREGLTCIGNSFIRLAF